MPVEPPVRDDIAAAKALAGEALPVGTITEQRQAIEQGLGRLPLPDGVAVEAVRIGDLDGEWLTPDGVEPDRAVVYLHGGGYVMGSIATHRRLATLVAERACAPVLIVDYRLAPEHPFPAALDDAVATYRWVLDRDGLDSARVVLAGDSAGGGLTLATMVRLRDEGHPEPAAAVCMSPWTDLSLSGDTMAANAAIDPLAHPESAAQWASAYLGGADPTDPLASPVYADLRGLPPLLIQVGTDETLLDDSLRFAANAEDAGVDVVLEVWDGMIHVFQAFSELLPESDTALDRIGDFIREHF